MTTRFADRPKVEPGDWPVAKDFRRRRWTIGRVVTDLAIVMVAVPLGLNGIADPAPRGFCGMTADFYAFSLGLAILAVRPAWLILKAMNDAGERFLTRLTSSRSRPKPKPLDDL